MTHFGFQLGRYDPRPQRRIECVLEGFGERPFMHMAQCRDIGIVPCRYADRVADGKVFELAPRAFVPFGLLRLAEL
jgi:hypothetical protein